MRALAFLMLCSVLASVPAAAQSLSGVHVGDRIGSVSISKQKPMRSTRSGPFTIQKWRLEDGNDLSVTSYASDGRIVYVETDWNGQASGAISDFGGFTYGKTTLAEIEDKFGSTGVLFRNHLSASTGDGEVARFSTYTVIGSRKLLATFVTNLSKQDAKKGTPDSVINRHELWKLSAIVLSDDDYLSTIWGNQVKVPDNIKEIQWVENGPDAQFSARFVCPESLDSENARDVALSDLAEWAKDTHPDWTVEHILDAYRGMLRTHKCTDSLEMTRNVKIPELFNGNWSDSEDKITACDVATGSILQVVPEGTKAPEMICKPVTAQKRDNGIGYTMRFLCAGEGDLSTSREIWNGRIFDGSLVLVVIDLSSGGVNLYKQCNIASKPNQQSQQQGAPPKP